MVKHTSSASTAASYSDRSWRSEWVRDLTVMRPVARWTQRDCHHWNEDLQSHFNCQARNLTSNSFNCQTSNSRNGSSNRREKRQWKKRSSASTAASAYTGVEPWKLCRTTWLVKQNVSFPFRQFSRFVIFPFRHFHDSSLSRFVTFHVSSWSECSCRISFNCQTNSRTSSNNSRVKR